jgi:hypothetical protein
MRAGPFKFTITAREPASFDFVFPALLKSRHGFALAPSPHPVQSHGKAAKTVFAELVMQVSRGKNISLGNAATAALGGNVQKQFMCGR